MKHIALLTALLTLSGCATYEAKNRILVCFGFCALQGVQLQRTPNGAPVLVVPKESVRE